jgi:uncharacterized RmlC-like cupin family protein
VSSPAGTGGNDGAVDKDGGDPAAELRLIRGGDLSAATAQTAGMVRAAAISGDLVGAQSLWMGRTTLPSGVSSG